MIDLIFSQSFKQTLPLIVYTLNENVFEAKSGMTGIKYPLGAYSTLPQGLRGGHQGRLSKIGTLTNVQTIPFSRFYIFHLPRYDHNLHSSLFSAFVCLSPYILFRFVVRGIEKTGKR